MKTKDAKQNVAKKNMHPEMSNTFTKTPELAKETITDMMQKNIGHYA